jgi:hypothetical protein
MAPVHRVKTVWTLPGRGFHKMVDYLHKYSQKRKTLLRALNEAYAEHRDVMFDSVILQILLDF